MNIFNLSLSNQNKGIFFSISVLFIICLFFLPIQPVFLDFFIVIIFSISILVIIVTNQTKRPLEFSTFPTILLIMTLFRLALNVVTTKNILMNGGSDGTKAAGEIIRTFSEILIGGNLAVGVVIFLVVLVINFLVITKGAGRSAEVLARFRLDSIPGKQMAIDSDLNAGIIDESEAKRRREEINQESEFYGAMDGASKYVRGEAIASFIIVVINFIGGLFIGMAQSNMSFSDASQVFLLLTIGDGLVSQIPALIISIAAGIIITRNSTETALGDQVGRQFRNHSNALYISAMVLIVVSLLPSTPMLPFLAIGLFFIFLGRTVDKTKKSEERDKIAKEELQTTESDNLESLLNLELVELQVGYGLIDLVDANQDGELLERISHLRKQFALDWGVIIPSVRITDNLELKPSEYSICLKGVKIAGGTLKPDYYMALESGNIVDKIDGIETKEPVFGLSAVWVREEDKDQAQYNGYTVVDSSAIIATHLTEIIKSNLHEIFGRKELTDILENIKQTNPKIIEDIIPDVLKPSQILKILQNLLKEGVSIRDMRTILETLAEHGDRIKDTHYLTELVRQALPRTITESIKSDQGDVPVFTLDSTVEEALFNNLSKVDNGGYELSLPVKTTQHILSSISEKIDEATEAGEKMVILCSEGVRSHFKNLTEKYMPNLIIITHKEISTGTKIRILGRIRL